MTTSSTLTDQVIARARQPITLHLPELDLDVTVGRPSVWDLVRAGRIPDHLTDIAARGLTGAEDNTTTGRDLSEFGELVDAVVCASMIDPPVSPDGPVKPGDLPWADRQYIYAVVARLGGAGELARFRGEPRGDDAPRPAGEGMADQAERPGGVPG